MATIELSSDYYLNHLQKQRRVLSNRRSILGRHHTNLNAFIERSLESLAPGSPILDAGCGLSIWTTPEMRRRWRIAGLDCQPASIEACRIAYPGEEFHLGDLYDLEWADASFDAVVMREVIEHFRHPERAVSEVARVLKPGGMYVLTTPNYSSPLLHVIEHTYNRFFGGPCKPYKDDVHPSKYTPGRLLEQLRPYFEDLAIETFDWGISIGCVARKKG